MNVIACYSKSQDQVYISDLSEEELAATVGPTDVAPTLYFFASFDTPEVVVSDAYEVKQRLRDACANAPLLMGDYGTPQRAVPRETLLELLESL